MQSFIIKVNHPIGGCLYLLDHDGDRVFYYTLSKSRACKFYQKITPRNYIRKLLNRIVFQYPNAITKPQIETYIGT